MRVPQLKWVNTERNRPLSITYWGPQSRVLPRRRQQFIHFLPIPLFTLGFPAVFDRHLDDPSDAATPDRRSHDAGTLPASTRLTWDTRVYNQSNDIFNDRRVLLTACFVVVDALRHHAPSDLSLQWVTKHGSKYMEQPIVLGRPRGIWNRMGNSTLLLFLIQGSTRLWILYLSGTAHFCLFDSWSENAGKRRLLLTGGLPFLEAEGVETEVGTFWVRSERSVRGPSAPRLAFAALG
jgi:hypothetical protein